MPLMNGNITYQRYLALGSIPDEDQIITTLEEERFRPFEDGLEEERTGACDWRNYLYGAPDKNWAFVDGKCFFGIRVDSRKVPGQKMKAHLEMKIQALKTQKGLAFVGKEAKTSLKDEVKAELLPKQTPNTKVIEVIWDMKTGLILSNAVSGKTQSLLRGIFAKDFGLETTVLTPGQLAGQARPAHVPIEDITSGNPIADVDPVLGPLFLMWLWRQHLVNGGSNPGSDDDTSAVLFGDAIQLMGESGDVKEATLKKGNPAESREALEALVNGMRPVSAKLSLKNGDMEWDCTFKAGTFVLSGLKLPPSTAKDDTGLLQDRLFLLEEGFSFIDSRYKAFLAEFEDGGIDGVTDRLQAWAKDQSENAPSGGELLDAEGDGED